SRLLILVPPKSPSAPYTVRSSRVRLADTVFGVKRRTPRALLCGSKRGIRGNCSADPDSLMIRSSHLSASGAPTDHISGCCSRLDQRREVVYVQIEPCGASMTTRNPGLRGEAYARGGWGRSEPAPPEKHGQSKRVFSSGW